MYQGAAALHVLSWTAMSEENRDIPENAMIGSWKLTEWLAEGGMGQVYVAKHELMGREAVVKLLHSKLLNDADVVRRFLNEARASAAIRHPGIVEIFDLGSDGDRVYIVMERLYGETLAERIARAPLIVGLVVTMVKQLVGALAAAHKHKIIHRDLKPENLFVVDDPDIPGGKRIKILDFGVAKLAPEQGGSGMTAQGMVFGTPAYMAPEQCQNSAQVDHRSDLYAVGCIMYEMLCSEPPFGHGGLELFAAHLRDIPARPSERGVEIPDDVEDIVLRLLAKEPADRFQSCDELLAALDNAKLTARRRARGKRRRSEKLAYAETVPPYVIAAEETAKVAQMPAPAPAPTPAPTNDKDERAADQSASDDARDRATRPQISTDDGAALGKQARKATSSPTTHRHATGQVIDAEEPAPEPEKKSKKGALLAAALVLSALVGGVAYKLVQNDQPAKQVRAIEPAPPPPPPPPSPPVPEPPSGQELLDEGKRALQNLQFADAAFAARQALAIAPADSDVHKAATELEAKAREGQKSQWTHENFVNAIEIGDVRGAVFTYQQLPRDSVFYQRATPKYESLRTSWLSPQTERATKLVGKKKCRKVDKMVKEVRRMFPEASAQFEEMAEECYVRRDKRRKKKPKPKEVEAGPDLTLPKVVPKVYIRQRLAKYNKRMKVCLIENPLEMHSKAKSVPVVATLQIEPDGVLSKFDITPSSSELSKCLYFELRGEQFPRAREASTMKYPVGKAFIRAPRTKPPEVEDNKASKNPDAAKGDEADAEPAGAESKKASDTGAKAGDEAKPAAEPAPKEPEAKPADKPAAEAEPAPKDD